MSRPPVFTEDPADFLQEVKETLKWDNLSGLTVMDVGCGTGQNSTRRIMETFPDIDRLIGIDIDPVIIEQAKRLYPHEKIEYHVADIRDSATIESWKGSIPRLFSYYCFSAVRSQKLAFDNIRWILGPCGEAALLFTVRTDHYTWFKDVVNKWKPYLGDDIETFPPEAQSRKYTAQTYTEMLEELGFYVFYCEEEFKTTEFKTDDELKTHLKNFLYFLMDKIPADKVAEFEQYSFDAYQKFIPRNERGLSHSSHTVVKIMIKKKFYV